MVWVTGWLAGCGLLARGVCYLNSLALQMQSSNPPSALALSSGWLQLHPVAAIAAAAAAPAAALYCDVMSPCERSTIGSAAAAAAKSFDSRKCPYLKLELELGSLTDAAPPALSLFLPLTRTRACRRTDMLAVSLAVIPL